MARSVKVFRASEEGVDVHQAPIERAGDVGMVETDEGRQE
jgi:hypothetical protein